MLVEMSMSNFRSFKDKVTFSMVASSIHELTESNSFKQSNFKLLKSAVIYGANASGKSNLIQGLFFMKYMLTQSFKEIQSGDDIPVEPFRLDLAMRNQASFFEVIFLFYGASYRYGFELNKERIHSEWLFKKMKASEAKLFVRDGREISVGKSFSEGVGLEKFVKENALFLSVAEQFNGDEAKKVFNWFRQCKFLSADRRVSFTNIFVNDERNKKNVLELMRNADLGIEDISIERAKVDEIIFHSGTDIPDMLKKKIANELTKITTHHKVFDNGKEVNALEEFNLEEQESQGTTRLFFLSGPILDTLLSGSILVIDELDSQLHPLITRELIKLFHSKEVNRHNAQLIFTTHDTSHLSNKFFRRDQIWFTEKDAFAASQAYSLVEFEFDGKKVRNDADYEKNYIMGKYGAVPFLGDFEFLGDLNGEG